MSGVGGLPAAPSSVLGSSTAATGLGLTDVMSAREEALARFAQINWKDYTKSDTFALTTSDVILFKKIEKLFQEEKPMNEIDAFVKDFGRELFRGLFKLIKNVTEPAVVRYALARLQSLLPDGIRFNYRLIYFIDEPTGRVEWGPFLRLVRAGHGYTELEAGCILAKILSCSHVNTEGIFALVEWVLNAFRGASTINSMSDPTRVSSLRAAVSSLLILIRNEKARDIVVEADGLRLLATTLENCKGRAQLSYELCCIMWTLTFSAKAIHEFGASGALAALVNQVKMAPREKVVRVALSALRNLMGKQEGVYNERMIDGGLLQTLNNMRERKWTDDDVVEAINVLREALLRDFKELNTMERYERELNTNHLEWGILHTDKFWRENCMDFEAKDFALIRKLISLLDTEDPTTLSVALYDLGDFVRFYPNGKLVAKRLGAKSVAMRLMQHENGEVQKYALQCISKMMVNKWEFVK